MGFSRQEYWSGLPSPPPGDLPNPQIEPTSLMSPALAGGFFTTSATWEAHKSTLLLGQKDPLEEGMATHSSILAWRIPWTEEPVGLESVGSQRVGLDLVTKQQQQVFIGQISFLL